MSQQSGNVPKVIPIKQISTFCTKWSVTGKVVKSEAVRTFKGKNDASSKVWNIVIADESAEILGVFWGKAVDVFQNVIKEGKVYSFSRGSIKMSNKKYTTCPHAYQLTFGDDAVITEIEDNDLDLSNCTRKFNTEGGLRNLKNSMRERVDCLGVVLSFRTEAQIKTKAGADKFIREFTICDSTGHKIRVDVWGNSPEELSSLTDIMLAGNPVVGIRNGRVSDFRGKTLSPSIENVEVFPQNAISEKTPQLKEQLDWFIENKDRVSTLVSLTEEYNPTGISSQKTNAVNLPGNHGLLSEANSAMQDAYVSQGDDSTEFYFRSVVYPTKWFYSGRDDPANKLTCLYDACAGCGKKWSSEIGCSSCLPAVAKRESRYILQGSVCDPSGSRFNCRFFGKQAESVIGVSATKIDELNTNGDGVGQYFDIDAVYLPIAVRFKANLNEYNGEKRLNVTALIVDRLEGAGFIDESLELLNSISSLAPEISTGLKRCRPEDPADVPIDTKRPFVSPSSV